jgi:hypothetical protein
VFAGHFGRLLALGRRVNGEDRGQNHLVPTFVHLLFAHNDNFDRPDLFIAFTNIQVTARLNKAQPHKPIDITSRLVGAPSSSSVIRSVAALAITASTSSLSTGPFSSSCPN